MTRFQFTFSLFNPFPIWDHPDGGGMVGGGLGAAAMSVHTRAQRRHGSGLGGRLFGAAMLPGVW
jgi:hypothetical protein